MGKGKEAWASKVGQVTLLDIKWKELDHGFVVEFLNTFVIKRFKIFLKKKTMCISLANK